MKECYHRGHEDVCQLLVEHGAQKKEPLFEEVTKRATEKKLESRWKNKKKRETFLEILFLQKKIFFLRVVLSSSKKPSIHGLSEQPE